MQAKVIPPAQASLIGTGVRYGASDVDSSYTHLPASVAIWAGLETKTGRFRSDDCAQHNLTDLNDSGATFAKIADLIESKPRGLFTNREETTNA